MTDHIIVGAGASGLYTAYRLLRDGSLPEGDTVSVYEWSDRPGGRIHTFTFPADGGGKGLYCEFGGVRFATDPGFPGATTEGHRIVQNVIIQLGLSELVVPFGRSSDRLYSLRGGHVYESDLTDVDILPYGFSDEFRQFLTQNKVSAPYTADNIIGAVAGLFAPGLVAQTPIARDGAHISPTVRYRSLRRRQAFPRGCRCATSPTGTCCMTSSTTKGTTTPPMGTAIRPTSSTGARWMLSRTTTTSAPRPAT